MILDFGTCLKSRCEGCQRCQPSRGEIREGWQRWQPSQRSLRLLSTNLLNQNQRPAPLDESTLLYLDRKLRRPDSTAFNLRPRLRKFRT